jgi:hypothetical protein
MLKAMDIKALPKPVKLAVSTKDSKSKDMVNVLQWIKDHNPVLHMKSWRIIDRQPELQCQQAYPIGRWNETVAMESYYISVELAL